MEKESKFSIIKKMESKNFTATIEVAKTPATIEVAISSMAKTKKNCCFGSYNLLRRGAMKHSSHANNQKI